MDSAGEPSAKTPEASRPGLVAEYLLAFLGLVLGFSAAFVILDTMEWIFVLWINAILTWGLPAALMFGLVYGFRRKYPQLRWERALGVTIAWTLMVGQSWITLPLLFGPTNPLPVFALLLFVGAVAIWGAVRAVEAVARRIRGRQDTDSAP